jgi:S1-C subfamily serine protease
MLASVDLTKPRSPWYVAALALASCLILVGGWLARPREIPQSPTPLPSETELEQLARRAERRSLDSMTNYFAGVARDVDSSIVRFPSARMSGIAWDEGLIVTAPLRDGRASGTISVATASGAAAAQPTLWGPQLPVTAFANPNGLAGLTPARRAASPPQPGDWIVAVWQTDNGRAFAAANFQQSAPTTCGLTPGREMVSSLSLTSAMVGGGLFDIEGGLLAVILPCREHIAAVASASIQAILERANAVDQRVLGRYGLAVGPLSEEEKAYFKATEGLLVREVWRGSAGDAAGVRPGDIITALGEQGLVKTDDLRPLTTASDMPFDLAVQRGSKTLKIALPGDALGAAQDKEAGAGLIWESSSRTYGIDAVVPGSRAALAGIESGDSLVRIDQAEPRNLDQVKRIFTNSKSSPVLLEVQRDGRRLAILVR